MDVEIRRPGPDDEQALLDAPALFDDPPEAEATRRFLAEPSHHLLFAFDPAGRPVGFVSGVETTHPDKGTESSSTSPASTSRQAVRGSAARSSTPSPPSPRSAAATGCGSSPTTTTSRRGRPTSGRRVGKLL